MPVIEICTFTATADEDTMRAADALMQTDFSYQQPGLLRRTTARGDDGQWCVVTLWATVADASRAEQAAASDVVAQAFWSLVDADSLTIQRYTLLD